MPLKSHKDFLKDRVIEEQVKMVYRQLPAAIVPPVFAAIIIAFLMHDKVTALYAWGWVAWVAACYFTLPPLWHRWYKKSNTNHINASTWGRRYVVMASLTASSWGASGVLLYVPGEIFYQVFLAGMLFTAAASAMVATVSYTPGYFAGVIPLLAPITIMFFLEGELVHYIFSGLLFMIFIMLTAFQRNMHKGLSETIALRFDHERLVSELEEKNNFINKATQSKSQFLAAASHDLRQPIHAQQLFLSELSARTDDGDTQQIISQMKHSMESMSSLLDELLAISKIDSGVVKAECKTFSLEPVLHKLEKQFHMMVAEKGLRFRISKCSKMVHSDLVMLERILRNFIQNAICYTATGSVLVVCRCRHGQLEIQVRDSGPGIPEKEQAHIFEEFVQLENSDNSTGNGLGLAIVKRLSALLDHDVGLRSQVGEGTTFFVRVPLSDAKSPTVELTQQATNTLADAKILVADDDHSILSAMGHLLNRWECDHVLASSMEQSLSYVNNDGFIPHILIADYHLEDGINGIDLINKVRERINSSLPAVLITSDISSDIVGAAQTHNCILMYKPVDSVGLYNLLCNLYLMHSKEKPSFA